MWVHIPGAVYLQVYMYRCGCTYQVQCTYKCTGVGAHTGWPSGCSAEERYNNYNIGEVCFYIITMGLTFSRQQDTVGTETIQQRKEGSNPRFVLDQVNLRSHLLSGPVMHELAHHVPTQQVQYLMIYKPSTKAGNTRVQIGHYNISLELRSKGRSKTYKHI